VGVSAADLLREAVSCLPAPSARYEAEELLTHVLQVNRAWLVAHADTSLDIQACERFRKLLQQRCNGEPLAYLIGRCGFWSLDLQVNPATLIPRVETELLVELALSRLPEQAPLLRIADLGTGSGAIALALARERPQAAIVATDVSAPALATALSNARRYGLEKSIWLRRGSWCQALGNDQFNLIVSNPPYIAEADPHLQQGDLRFEPPLALTSGVDGLDAIREIIHAAPEHLVAKGWLLLEHGWDQGEKVRALLQHTGFVYIQTQVDLERRDRVTLGQWPS